MLKNPYPPPLPGSENHKLYTRVAPEDYFWLRRRLPYTIALTDKILAILYKKFIDELRRIDASEPFEPAICIDDPTYDRILTVLSGCSFGQPVGEVGARDDQRGTSSLHPEVRDTQVERPDEKSSPKVRGRSTKKVNKKGLVSGPSDGVA